MAPGAARRLTDRQRSVMERIDRRVPIKVIAQELGVSETRINQHIRALKDFYEAGSLGDLVENYRATLTPEAAEASSENDLDNGGARGGASGGASGGDNGGADGGGNGADAALLKPFSEAAYTISQINLQADLAELGQREDPGQLVLSDAMPLIEQAPWLRPGEPRVVPGVLDGEHAVLFRLGAIVGIASGILAAVILAVTAAMTLSAATEGKATLSAESRVAAG